MKVNDKSKFDHVFEGYSVWLEPSPNDVREIMQEMETLSKQCGDVERGTYPFPLHCTLLYNFDSSRLALVKEDEEYYMQLDNEDEMGLKLLELCIQKYQDFITDEDPRATLEKNECDKDCSIYLNPTDFYFFPYPKHADNGRGFGCVISMLLLENNENLQLLQRIVKDVFPPDERHSRAHTIQTIDDKKESSGGNDENEDSSCTKQMNDCTSTPCTPKCTNDKDITSSKKKSKSSICNTEKRKFIPHMALVYAPEIYHDMLKERTEHMKVSKQHILMKPLKAKFFSLWSTRGTLKDWKCICRVDLDKS